jgi:HEPN domain-containing protein
VNRNDLQELSRTRIRESRLLLKAGQYGGAYYLAGYAAECALKACIARLTRRHDFPDKKTVDSSYTHNLEALVRVAGLDLALIRMRSADARFDLNWSVVKDWSESSRYELTDRQSAESLVAALGGSHGVLRWLREYW